MHPKKPPPGPGYVGSYENPVGDRMPGTVKAIRVLLFVVAALTVIVAIGTFLYADVGDPAYAAGAVTWAALPGIASLVLRRGSRVLWWCLLALEIVYILLALANLGRGDPRGITNMVLPIVILVLLFQRSSRRYFRPEGL